MVSCFKLVWRILSSHSLWVSWIKKISDIITRFFFTVRKSTLNGSWMWRKILKCREIAKDFSLELRLEMGEKHSFGMKCGLHWDA